MPTQESTLNGQIVRSENLVRCPNCNEEKTVFVWSSELGVRCVDCSGHADQLQQSLALLAEAKAKFPARGQGGQQFSTHGVRDESARGTAYRNQCAWEIERFHAIGKPHTAEKFVAFIRTLTPHTVLHLSANEIRDPELRTAVRRLQMSVAEVCS